MPLYNKEPANETPLPMPEVKASPVTRNSDYQDNVVDAVVHPISELVTHIDGSSWTVDYYSQILGSDQVQEGQDLAAPDVLQSYRLIKDLELKVTAALTSTQDEQTQEFSVTGTAFIYAAVIPNIGDMFIANIGDGRDGVLEVTSAKRMTHLEGSCYEVNYEVVDYLNDARQADLDAKVVAELVFSRERLANATKGLLTDYDVVSLSDVDEMLEKLAHNYYHTFYHQDQRTLMIPESMTYDPHVVRFMYALNSGEFEAPNIRELILSHETLRYDTIYSVLLADSGLGRATVKRMRDASPWEFSNVAVLGGIAHSRAEHVVFPYGTATIGMDEGKVALPTEPVDMLIPVDPLPDIISVEADPYYVFSQNFYKGELAMSVLEKEVGSFMSGDAVNVSTVLDLCNKVDDWMIEDYFYYTPILMMLLKTFHKEL